MQILRRFRRRLREVTGLFERTDQMLINQGLQLSLATRGKVFPRLSDYEWKVFSQWGEDGILDFLVRTVPIANETFIEFGVENFTESNCRYLLQASDWQGFVIDGSDTHVEDIHRHPWFWKHDLRAVSQFITAENIDDLLMQSGFDGDLGILSVDIDGVDWFILQSITTFRPRILVVEFNPVFGQTRKVSVPYDPSFQRSRKHHSNLYWGASIAAFEWLAAKRGMTLVGTGRMGANAFFVRNDLMTPHLNELARAPYNCNFRFRESRDPSGRLDYLGQQERIEVLRGMPLFNVETREVEAF